MNIPQRVFGEELPKGRSGFTVEVECENKGKMLHEGRREKFTWFSDEPPRIGGDDSHPQPLTYLTGGVGM